MSVGVLLDAYMVVPNTLLLAYSKTKFILLSHIVALLAMVPITYFLSIYYGAIGGAVSVAFILGGYFIFLAPFIFKYCLKGHYFKWLWHDILKVGLPLVAGLSLIRFTIPGQLLQNRLLGLMVLGIIGILLMLVSIKISGLTFFDKYLFWKKTAKA